MLRFEKYESVVTVQRDFRVSLTLNLHQLEAFEDGIKLSKTLIIYIKENHQVDHELPWKIVKQIRQSVVRSPQKSIRRASKGLVIPPASACHVLRKILIFKPFRIQLMQTLHNDNMQNGIFGFAR